MNWFKNILGFNTRTTPEPIQHPPRPADWCKTFADLNREMEEGKRHSIGPPEVGWARDYERSLLPEGSRFPKKGDVYEAAKDLEVTYMTSWAGPHTGGGKTMIRKGERFWVDSVPADDEPLGTYALAVQYEEIEQRVVDASERSDPKYTGFYFYFETLVLNQCFTLVETGDTNQESSSAAADTCPPTSSP